MPLKSFTHAGHLVQIFPDDDPMNPRKECDNLGIMLCWHRRYTLGDEQPSSDPTEALASLLDGAVADRLERRSEREHNALDYRYRGRYACDEHLRESRELNREHAARVAAEVAKVAIVLPLFLYEHSGITMRCSPFSCPWDSGQVGFIYVTLANVRQEWSSKRVTKAIRDKAIMCLVQEVATYDRYLTGGYTGFVVSTIDEDGEILDEVDSCWGFDDPDYCEQEARHVAEFAAKREAERDAATLALATLQD